jgi:hypothetical protein
MLSVITLLLYLSFLNMLMLGNNNFKKNSNVLLPSELNVTDIIIKKPIRVKLCHFKCDCFFSHNVKNDNICVPNPIRPIGFF